MGTLNFAVRAQELTKERDEDRAGTEWDGRGSFGAYVRGTEARMHALEQLLDEARAQIDDLLAGVAQDDGFGCCGGSDETPPQHTQDCSVHPPRCVRCGEHTSVDIVANGDRYESRCAECLVRERDEARAEAARLLEVALQAIRERDEMRARHE